MRRPSIHLEPITRKHTDAIQGLASEPALAKTTNLPDPYPPDGAANWIAALDEKTAAGTEVAWAILNDGMLVGVVGFLEIRESPPEAELGYWIGKPYWGRGYATAATTEAVRVAFGKMALDRITAAVHETNPSSVRVLEKLGFRHTHDGPPSRGDKWTSEDVFQYYELRRHRAR